MALNKVLISIEAPGGTVCVDIFSRPDGAFGFEEYRREPEDGRGWYVTGFHAGATYQTQAEATAAARVAVLWLADLL